MPVFPFHTWQPDVYEQSNYPTVMVLSGLMVKMGVFGLIRWMLPIFPAAVAKYDNIRNGFMHHWDSVCKLYCVVSK